jgi:anion-transporting  ArsA/GET3 family ATPase
MIGSAFADNTNIIAKDASTMSRSEQRAEAKRLVGRLQEIKSVVESTQLTFTERRELKKEVQTIKEQMQKMDGVTLYLSLTAILIILILILLL